MLPVSVNVLIVIMSKRIEPSIIHHAKDVMEFPGVAHCALPQIAISCEEMSIFSLLFRRPPLEAPMA